MTMLSAYGACDGDDTYDHDEPGACTASLVDLDYFVLCNCNIHRKCISYTNSLYPSSAFAEQESSTSTSTYSMHNIQHAPARACAPANLLSCGVALLRQQA